jgi:hypothetical protein
MRRCDFLVPQHLDRMKPLLGKIAMFAINKIKEQLAFMQSKQGQKAFAEECLCSIRWNYNIPCIHLLPAFGPIAPTLIAKRWHLAGVEILGKAWFRCHVSSVHSTYLLQFRVPLC